ncbi:hypothetical protein [Kitasatospora purpeofusca]|uniref:hypothetical protein n=1 Tax=Kitasatospora purpeofusca TaxID=67352 RepID=UPI003F4AC097
MSPKGRGVVGVSDTGVGVWGQLKQGRAIVGAVDEEGTGVWAETKKGRALVAAVNGNEESTAVWAETKKGRSIVGLATNEGVGVWAATRKGRALVAVVDGDEESTAVWAETKKGRSVVGLATNEGVGVWAETRKGRALVAVVDGDEESTAVWAETKRGQAVVGIVGGHGDAIAGTANDSGSNGIFGRNNATSRAPAGGPPVGNGVFGYTEVPNASGVVGAVAGGNTEGAGVCGIGPVAGRFFGDVVVTGDVVVNGDVKLVGADLAEHFATADSVSVEPGTVMVIDGVDRVRVSESAYDRRVAGVVSGAGEYRPGVVLDHQGEAAGRQALALVGKVYCKADASFGAIEAGDLLTTSPTPGHAMKADDAARSFGAVLGKAMAPLADGTGLLPILVTLH